MAEALHITRPSEPPAEIRCAQNAGRAEVVGLARHHDREAVLPGQPDGVLRNRSRKPPGPGRFRRRRPGSRRFRRRRARPPKRVHLPAPQPLHVEGEQLDAVGVDAAQVRVHEPIGHQAGLRSGHAGGFEEPGGEVRERPRPATGSRAQTWAGPDRPRDPSALACAMRRMSSATRSGESTFFMTSRLVSPAVSRDRLPMPSIRCVSVWSTRTS